MVNTDWTFNEFLVFLLIYASHADIDFCEHERNLIKEKVPVEVFDSILDHFNSLTDYQALELILSYKDVYYQTEEEKEHLLEELQNLFEVDGEYSSLEKEMMFFLTKIM
ncbi:MAG: hypothetical protein P1U56_10390 [Saprospiraceae bacterium]|nr:hypothetical protein [Saprospiraceae bacterium]